MSFSTILSAAIAGLRVEFVRVEADVSNGLPVFHMVGYLSSEVKEAGERVRTAIKNSGFDYPAKRTVINLSPATLRKKGASFDLPIAVSILASLGQISPEKIEKCLIIGELSLDGQVRKVPGILPIAMEALENGITCCIVPKENEREGRLVKGMAFNSSIVTSSFGIDSGTNNPPSSASPFKIASEAVAVLSEFLVLLYSRFIIIPSFSFLHVTALNYSTGSAAMSIASVTVLI